MGTPWRQLMPRHCISICCCQDGDEGGVIYTTLQTPPAKPPRAGASSPKDEVPETVYGKVTSA